ncbi:MAG: tail fiber protein [Chitinophagaceae bacterium]
MWFLAEIRILPYEFTPAGWMPCDGRPLTISENDSLFHEIGHIFGGDDYTFRLPDLRGKVLLHEGEGFAFPQAGGESGHVLTVKEMAQHKHLAIASSEKANEPTPKHNFWARDRGYGTTPNTKVHEAALGNTGAGEAHDNMAPFASVNYCIATTGRPLRSAGLNPFIGFITAVPFPFDSHPDWLLCDGRELPASGIYQKLYSVIGNAFGGTRDQTFRLPDLRGRVLVGQGKGEGLSRYQVGDTGGATQVTLTEAHLPAHTHDAIGKIEGDNPTASDTRVWANGSGSNQSSTFATEKGEAPMMNPGVLNVAGEGAPHNNMMPYQVLNFIIAMDGLFPPKG